MPSSAEHAGVKRDPAKRARRPSAAPESHSTVCPRSQAGGPMIAPSTTRSAPSFIAIARRSRRPRSRRRRSAAGRRRTRRTPRSLRLGPRERITSSATARAAAGIGKTSDRRPGRRRPAPRRGRPARPFPGSGCGPRRPRRPRLAGPQRRADGAPMVPGRWTDDGRGGSGPGESRPIPGGSGSAEQALHPVAHREEHRHDPGTTDREHQRPGREHGCRIHDPPLPGADR